ncbi:hypothetical protein TNCV_2084821 [Trichonephila clavipes]|uniref:Uncharacterized protein n=1 Tax=Trichonephila clavipes TaxID=2585209 RepID=A0A8X6RNB7_TRICX|nr:hypothetical protein TNCV_2084821 [Trichonephila clavipes]
MPNEKPAKYEIHLRFVSNITWYEEMEITWCEVRNVRMGGPIPTTENALSSSHTSVLPLSNYVHQNHITT